MNSIEEAQVIFDNLNQGDIAKMVECALYINTPEIWYEAFDYVFELAHPKMLLDNGVGKENKTAWLNIVRSGFAYYLGFYYHNNKIIDLPFWKLILNSGQYDDLEKDEILNYAGYFHRPQALLALIT
jgi:hypothetical protein